MTYFASSMSSPVGRLRLVVNDAGQLAQIDFQKAVGAVKDAVVDDARCQHVAAQLREYFTGTRREFDLELCPHGTPFQLRVWEELRRIPFGTTCSYAAIARALGQPTATRAVGAANGKNPIPIVVPCHRVIGADGSLTGFGGGLPAKRTLLRLEGLGELIAD